MANLAIKHIARVGEVTEQERDVEHPGLGHEVAERAGGNDGGLDRTDLQPFDHFALAAEAGGGEVTEGIAPVSVRLDHFLPFLGCHAIMRGRRERIADLDFLLGLSGRYAGKNAKRGYKCR
ncbi:hypothetical protein A33O_02039 [Nitratireductor aquibiodomus RA22]|uniref:Uncharacterized protein n=1 Tax=Nitratireductor aquibiodomus RA22 TaxID=1189611 RepID=I5C705_9HYPH|nr:hypothetical protein A33O_02039 [Nitratireductor aquibiodomus RA22]